MKFFQRPAHEIMVLMLTFALSTCLCAIIFSLCYRVIVDGNDDLSKSITSSLMALGISIVAGLAASLGINKITQPPPPTT